METQIESFTCSFARTTHSFVCPGLLTSLARSPALIRFLARSFNSKLVGKCMIWCLKTTWFCSIVECFQSAEKHLKARKKALFLTLYRLRIAKCQRTQQGLPILSLFFMQLRISERGCVRQSIPQSVLFYFITTNMVVLGGKRSHNQSQSMIQWVMME